MNNIKNFIIIVLSLIVLTQSVLLVRLLAQRRAYRQQKITKEIRFWEKEAKKTKGGPEEKMKLIPKQAQGKIAIVLDDWGYNLKNSDFITGNDFHVTLSVLPFRTYSTQVAQLASQSHKDVIIHMPMEPHNKENYGLEENTLLTGMPKKTLVRLLDAAFENVPSARGMSNHMGSKATEDASLMRIVLEYLKTKHCFFLDSMVTPKSVCSSIARTLRLVFFQRDVFIDNDSDSAYIRAQLLKLSQKAKQIGVAIGIGHDRLTTTAVLKQVIPELQAQGYQFVCLSEITSPQHGSFKDE